MSLDVNIEMFAMSDIGGDPEKYEERILLVDLTTRNKELEKPHFRQFQLGEQGALFIIADGGAGEQAGEVASQLAVQHIYENFLERIEQKQSWTYRECVWELKQSIKWTNYIIYKESLKNQYYNNMGAALTAALIIGGKCYLFQIGSSRAYFYRSDHLACMTVDQTRTDAELLAVLFDDNSIIPKNAGDQSRSSISFNVLGKENKIHTQLSWVSIKYQDLLLMCSDGLHSSLTDNEIAKIISSSSDLEAITKLLIDQAREKGRTDNMTVILSRFTGESLSLPSEQHKLKWKPFDIDETLEVQLLNEAVTDGQSRDKKEKITLFNNQRGQSLEEKVLPEENDEKEVEGFFYTLNKKVTLFLSYPYRQIKKISLLKKAGVLFLSVLLVAIFYFMLYHDDIEQITPKELEVLNIGLDSLYNEFLTADYSVKKGAWQNLYAHIQFMSDRMRDKSFMENQIKIYKEEHMQWADSMKMLQEFENALATYKTVLDFLEGGNEVEEYIEEVRELVHQQELARIQQLLNQAEEAYSDNRLTTPKSGEPQTAIMLYNQVIQIDPENKEADEGIRKIKNRLLELAEIAKRVGRWDRAKRHYNNIILHIGEDEKVRKLIKECNKRLTG